MLGQELEVIYGLDVISPLDVWEVIYKQLQEGGFSSSTPVSLDGEKMSLGNVYEKILSCSLVHFHVDADDMSFVYSPVTAWKHTLINIKNQSESMLFDWDNLVESLLERACFIQAWVSDIDYAFWQNANDVLQYDAHGKSYQGLPMKSNGLPPPLEQMDIDTSENLGRRDIKLGYVEAIGSCMWLSNEFWSRVGTKKESVIQKFVKDSRLISEDVTRFKFLNEPFTDIASSQVQKSIRDVLYYPQKP